MTGGVVLDASAVLALLQEEVGADQVESLLDGALMSSVNLAEVIRATEGPLANVRGVRPEAVDYAGAAEPLQEVWVAVRANLRAVLESVTLADLASGELPAEVRGLTTDPEAWQPH